MTSDAAAARPPMAKLIAAFAAVYTLWGGTFLAIRYAVADVPPLLTIGIRCAGGALLLYAWLWWRGRLTPVTRHQWRRAGIAGVLLFLGCHGLLAWAEQRVSSGQAAVLLSTIPLWLMVLGSAQERRFPSGRVLVGLALGTVGVVFLSGGAKAVEAWSGTALDRVALLASAFLWAAGSIVGRRGVSPESALQTAAMQLAAGAVAVLGASAATGELSAWSPAQLTPRAVGSLVFLVVGGTVIGMSAYVWLLTVVAPVTAGTYAYVNPVVALALGWLVGDEPFRARTLVAAAIILVAVALTRERPKGVAEERPRRGPIPADTTPRLPAHPLRDRS